VLGHIQRGHEEVGDAAAISDGAVADGQHVDEGVVPDVGHRRDGGHGRPVGVVHDVARHFHHLARRRGVGHVGGRHEICTVKCRSNFVINS
jgi:hypothetical protein